VEALELRVSNLALVPLLCGLEHHVIMGSALPARRFLVVDLIKQEHVLVNRWTSGLSDSSEFIDGATRWYYYRYQL
jgi:hypothetical protein